MSQMTGAEAMVRVYLDVPLLDQPLDGDARHRWKLRAQKGVEPLTRQGNFNGNGFSSRGHRQLLEIWHRSTGNVGGLQPSNSRANFKPAV